MPPHLSGAYRYLGLKEGDLPITEEFAKSLLSLPLFAGISTEQQDTQRRIFHKVCTLPDHSFDAFHEGFLFPRRKFLKARPDDACHLIADADALLGGIRCALIGKPEYKGHHTDCQ